MFSHLLHLIHLSNPDELSSQAVFAIARSLKKFINHTFALAELAKLNKLPDFIRKSASLSLFKTNLETYLLKTRHSDVTRFFARFFLFRHAMNDNLIMMIICFIDANESVRQTLCDLLF